jgi:hypothetical protein
MEELHTDSIDGSHEANYGAKSRARERADSNRFYTRGFHCRDKLADRMERGHKIG